MTTHLLSKSLGVVALIGVMGAGSAQACMPGMPMQPSAQPCAKASTVVSSCPVSDQVASNGDACILSQQDVSKAKEAMGMLAGNGIGIAQTVMRAISDQAQRFAMQY